MQTLTPVSKVALSGNTFQDSCIPGLAALIVTLLDAGIGVDIRAPFAAYLRSHGVDISRCAAVEALPHTAGAVISIGGDGTFLHSAEWAADSGIPVMGINTGHLGFLACYSLNDTARLLDALLRGRGVVEQRMLLRTQCPALPADVWPYALNEVALLKEETASMIEVCAHVDGNFLADYRADGLIVATPTGSTAYSLSAGGPILQPTLSCMALSPVAPHSLTVRPLVVEGGSEVTLVARSRTPNCLLSLDGRSFHIPSGTEIRIRRASFCTAVVCHHDENFISILRDKLLWDRH